MKKQKKLDYCHYTIFVVQCQAPISGKKEVLAMIDKKGAVLAYMKEHGSITQMEAIDLCMATRLSGIIFRLKNEGWPITAIWQDDGNGTRWTRYYLGKGAPQRKQGAQA